MNKDVVNRVAELANKFSDKKFRFNYHAGDNGYTIVGSIGGKDKYIYDMKSLKFDTITKLSKTSKQFRYFKKFIYGIVVIAVYSPDQRLVNDGMYDEIYCSIFEKLLNELHGRYDVLPGPSDEIFKSGVDSKNYIKYRIADNVNSYNISVKYNTENINPITVSLEFDRAVGDHINNFGIKDDTELNLIYNATFRSVNDVYKEYFVKKIGELQWDM